MNHSRRRGGMHVACGLATTLALLAPGALIREARARDLAARIDRGERAAFSEAAAEPSLEPCVEDALLAHGSEPALDALIAAGGPCASAALRARASDVRDEHGLWCRTDDSEAANIIDERLARRSWWRLWR